MASPRNQTSTVQDLIRAELASIKDNVAGVHGSVVATSDGLLVAHDVPDLEPAQIAALAATTHALAYRATLATGRGQFHETVTRGSHGYLAVYAVSDNVIVAVIGSPQLNVGKLHYQARAVIERLARHATQLSRTAPPRPEPQAATETAEESRAIRPLPRRRSAGRRES